MVVAAAERRPDGLHGCHRHARRHTSSANRMGGMVMPSIYQRSGKRILSITACSSNIGLRGAFAKEMAGGSASMTEAITSAPTLQHYIRKTEGQPPRGGRSRASRPAAWYADEWAKTPRRVWHEWSEQLVPHHRRRRPNCSQGIDCPLLSFGPSRCVKLSLEEAQALDRQRASFAAEIIDSASQALAFARAEECADSR